MVVLTLDFLLCNTNHACVKHALAASNSESLYSVSGKE